MMNRLLIALYSLFELERRMNKKTIYLSVLIFIDYICLSIIFKF